MIRRQGLIACLRVVKPLILAFEISVLVLSDKQPSKRYLTAHSVFLGTEQSQTKTQAWSWNSGIGRLRSKDARMSLSVSSLPLLWSIRAKPYNGFYLLGTFMHQESSVFSDFCVWTHPTQVKSNFVESRCHSPYRVSCFEKMNKYIVPGRLHMTMPYTRSSLSVSYPLSFEPTPHCRLMLFCWCRPNASFDLLTPPRWHSSVGLSPTYVIDGLSSTPTCRLSGFFL